MDKGLTPPKQLLLGATKWPPQPQVASSRPALLLPLQNRWHPPPPPPAPHLHLGLAKLFIVASQADEAILVCCGFNFHFFDDLFPCLTGI